MERKEDNQPIRATERATLLERLADPDDCVDAARSLWTIEVESARRMPRPQGEHPTREEQDARRLEALQPALELLADDLHSLIPGWIARYVELLQAAARDQRLRMVAVKAGEDPPSINTARILATLQLRHALQAAGERIDPYLQPLVDVMGTMDRDADEHLAAALRFAGPALASAAAKLLSVLREHGIWCRPSQLGAALARASAYDEQIVAALQRMLSDENETLRTAAIAVLGIIGPAARPAADQLLEFRNGDEGERCGMIHALARQGSPSPRFLEILAEAMRDENGYVRCAAADALGKLAVDPPRFVPLLLEACDWTEFLHDVSLPEIAVAAIGGYGPAARNALPRLTRFLEGPIKERTVPPRIVREAIARITAGGEPTQLHEWSPQARREPVSVDEPLFPVMYLGKQSYVDRQGRLAIRTEFPSGSAFSEGLAILRRRRSEAVVIDIHGREVFQSRWDEIGDFSEGLAPVRTGGKWGFIDRAGGVVVEPQYDSVTAFSEGLAGIEVGREEEHIRRSISFTRHGRRGFIDRTGAVVIPPNWLDAYPFHDGRALVCTGGAMKPNPLLDDKEVLSDRKHGYIDYGGRLVIPGEHDLAHPFSEGRAAVRWGEFLGRARYGYIDLEGNTVIPPRFTSAQAFSDGLALVRRRGRKHRQAFVVIDRNGTQIVELPYRYVQPFSEGLAAAFHDGMYGYVDRDGRWAIERQFDEAEPFSNGLAAVKRGEWSGLIDHSGAFVWGPTTEGCFGPNVRSEWMQ